MKQSVWTCIIHDLPTPSQKGRCNESHLANRENKAHKIGWNSSRLYCKKETEKGLELKTSGFPSLHQASLRKMLRSYHLFGKAHSSVIHEKVTASSKPQSRHEMWHDETQAEYFTHGCCLGCGAFLVWNILGNMALKNNNEWLKLRRKNLLRILKLDIFSSLT